MGLPSAGNLTPFGNQLSGKKRGAMNTVPGHSKGRLIPTAGKLGAKVTPAQALPSPMGTVAPHTGHGVRAGSGNQVPTLHGGPGVAWPGQAGP